MSGLLGAADLPGFVEVIAGRAEVFDYYRDVLDRNIPLSLTAVPLNFTTLLHGVALVRLATLCLFFNVERVGLGAIRHHMCGSSQNSGLPPRMLQPRPQTEMGNDREHTMTIFQAILLAGASLFSLAKSRRPRPAYTRLGRRASRIVPLRM